MLAGIGHPSSSKAEKFEFEFLDILDGINFEKKINFSASAPCQFFLKFLAGANRTALQVGWSLAWGLGGAEN